MFIGVVLTVFFGCAILPTKPTLPDYCAGSVYAQAPEYFDAGMNVMVVAVNMLAIADRPKYEAAKEAAKLMIGVLEPEPGMGGGSPLITVASMIGIAPEYGMVLSPLLSMFPINSVLNRCDREIIVKYLRIITG